MLQGKIVRWDRERGFGFIRVAGRPEDIFLHISQWPAGAGAPRAGVSVQFELTQDDQGRSRAEKLVVNNLRQKVAPRAQARSTKRPQPKQPAYVIVLPAVAGVVVLALAAWYWRATGSELGATLLSLWYVGISAVTFAAFSWDKFQAQAGGWRTRETTLHTLSLLGGWPGGLLAMQLLRHKTRKLSFQILFWIAVAGNIYLMSGDQLGLFGQLRGLR